MKLLKYKIVTSPVGDLKIVVENQTLVAVLWENALIPTKWHQMIEDGRDFLILETERQLNEYFLRQRRAFDLPIKMRGTPFQQKVWKLLTQIPYGSTWSYKQMAIKMDNPHAARAIGNANGRNLLSIIVPCHRVIAANGSLAGFAGGVDIKKFLIDLEL